ncbi:MAG TPA: hypothetical protein VL989_00555 [Candidatus Sulfotelmatobacter sp.]|nr:hypothetical protein [Candidatus Sulfotelmatobacter sp.]
MSAQNNSPSGWVGWIYFASFMLMVIGVLQAIAGLTGIFKGGFYVVTQSHLLVFDYRTWGWISLVLGIIIFMAGYELLKGSVWARVIAIILACLSIIANVAFINAYPIWSVIIIVIDVIVIYSLFVHGDELGRG